MVHDTQHCSDRSRCLGLSMPDNGERPRVLILDAQGSLGQHFHAVYPDTSTPRTDIADHGAVRKILDDLEAQVLIKCAGRCGSPNIDWCKAHSAEWWGSRFTHSFAPQIMARRWPFTAAGP